MPRPRSATAFADRCRTREPPKSPEPASGGQRRPASAKAAGAPWRASSTGSQIGGVNELHAGLVEFGAGRRTQLGADWLSQVSEYTHPVP